VLAADVTARVHGADEEEKARRASEQLFSGNAFALPVQDLLATLGDAPSTAVTLQQLQEERPITQWLVDTGMVSSRSEATRLIRGGGIYLNDECVKDEKRRLGVDDLWKGALAVLAKGKRLKHVLKLTAGG
jgi:tyrosyl-tRNA synthetase